jgi:hypothetical protein
LVKQMLDMNGVGTEPDAGLISKFHDMIVEQ